MKVWLAWSSGKDSAWALHVLRQREDLEVVALLTTLNDEQRRVAMHGVRRSLLLRQAAAAGLPCVEVPLPWPCSNEQYERLMESATQRAVESGVDGIAFGDLFLKDVREYRERQLDGTGLQPLFPLWGLDTTHLAHEMVEAGLEATLTCIDSRQLDPSFSGRRFDLSLLQDLPRGVDPCGERGEFHTMVTAGPMFDRRLSVQIGEQVERDGFVFTDLI